MSTGRRTSAAVISGTLTVFDARAETRKVA
jgi:hypothetical protein